MSAPVIGLSCATLRARWGPWDGCATLLPARYADEVSRAGAVPVLLPPVQSVAAAAGRLDGLILTGGGDVGPAAYGARPGPLTRGVSRERDEAEFALLRAALQAGLPVLGICRGLQVMNVALGGTLRQHLPPQAGHTPDPGSYGSHRVRIAPGSRLATLLGPGDAPGEETGPPRAGPTLAVPTSHHQAVDRLGAGLTATAWADDGVIEAVELAQAPGRHPFTLAVQWHPEQGTDPRLLRALAAAAARR